MTYYLVPPSATAVLEPDPAWRHEPDILWERQREAFDTRVSHRHFRPEPLPEDVQGNVLAHLAEVQAHTPGVRFVVAINPNDRDQKIWDLDDRGNLERPFVPENWVDLYLQEEYATAPFVVVAIVECDIGWRRYEHQVISATAALGRAWNAVRCTSDSIEGSVFAGVLAGWLRSHGRIGPRETTAVALALGFPEEPLAHSANPPNPKGRNP